MHKSIHFLISIFFLIGFISCGQKSDEVTENPQALFWQNLSKHCGIAFSGGLVLEPPGDDMLTGTEKLIAHFVQCDDDTIKIAFHIEIEDENRWDRSRTWIFINHGDRLELRHDHRKEDGSEDEVTWYGGFTEEAGSATTQEFIYYGRQDPEGKRLGWRIVILPNERYTYGTIRGDEWTWRVDFDLTKSVPQPPPAWGHE